jgi:hypothetical protein
MAGGDSSQARLQAAADIGVAAAAAVLVESADAISGNTTTDVIAAVIDGVAAASSAAAADGIAATIGSNTPTEVRTVAALEKRGGQTEKSGGA